MPITPSDVRAVLARFHDPETGRSITELEQVHRLEVEGANISVTLGLTTWSAPLGQETAAELTRLVEEHFPDATVTVDLAEHHRPPEKIGQVGLAGKGGVGKSSVAAFLACGLARSGSKVGLLDADVYGPSIPHLFGVSEHPRLIDEKIQPVEVSGLKLLSMGLLIPPGEAVIWRGPMLHSALTQFLRDTAWGDLDYLVIDMPPGTGDVAISLSQLLPLAGAVVNVTAGTSA